MEDQAIIQLFFERNETAINELKQKYGSYCHTVACNILENEEDAQECINDALLRVWNSIPPNQPQSLLAYFRSVTRNICYDRYRHQQRRGGKNTVTVALDEIESVFFDCSDPESEHIQKEISSAIATFVDQLKEFDRNIFLCRYYYFFSVTDIAKRYHKSRQHIQTTLTRTLKKLKQYLEKENFV